MYVFDQCSGGGAVGGGGHYKMDHLSNLTLFTLHLVKYTYVLCSRPLTTELHYNNLFSCVDLM